MQGIDTVLVGRNTYDWLKQRGHDFPHRQLESYVITSRAQATEDKVQFYNGDLQKLVVDLKSREGKGIFCDGGAQLVHQLLQMELVDQCIISTIPVLLGGGKRLFQSGFSQQKLDLQSVRSFSSGLVQSHYRVKS